MAAKKKGAAGAPAAERHVGTVDHYYPKVKAAAVHLDASLKVGDTIHIKGATDDYTEKVTSMQIDHQPIDAGRAGQDVGVRVPVKVHKHSEVLTVQPAGASGPARAKAAPKKAKAAKAATKAARKPARKATKAKKAARRVPKRGKKGTSGKRSKSPGKRSATKARKVARKAARRGKARGR